MVRQGIWETVREEGCSKYHEQKNRGHRMEGESCVPMRMKYLQRMNSWEEQEKIKGKGRRILVESKNDTGTM